MMRFFHKNSYLLALSVTILCSCTPAAQRTPEPTFIVVPYGSDRTPTAIPAAVAVAPAGMILGSSKAQVDQLLNDWSSRQDRTSTSETDIYRYTRGVTMIVAFRNDQAIGVYVIDNPGAGVTGISRALVAELSPLIGAEPNASDVVSDEYGIREFGVGDVTSW
jgi:hypothetical protein